MLETVAVTMFFRETTEKVEYITYDSKRFKDQIHQFVMETEGPQTIGNIYTDTPYCRNLLSIEMCSKIVDTDGDEAIEIAHQLEIGTNKVRDAFKQLQYAEEDYIEKNPAVILGPHMFERKPRDIKLHLIPYKYLILVRDAERRMLIDRLIELIPDLL